MTLARKRLKEWGYPIIMAVMATGIVIEAFLLVPVMQKQSSQSAQGAQARVTQCQVRPVTIKKEDWFHASGVTSEADRQLVLRAMPSKAECARLLADRP